MINSLPDNHAYLQRLYSLHCIRLVTAECTRGVIDPLYHSRHNGRDRQHECDRGIRYVNNVVHRCLPRSSVFATSDASCRQHPHHSAMSSFQRLLGQMDLIGDSRTAAGRLRCRWAT